MTKNSKQFFKRRRSNCLVHFTVRDRANQSCRILTIIATLWLDCFANRRAKLCQWSSVQVLFDAIVERQSIANALWFGIIFFAWLFWALCLIVVFFLSTKKKSKRRYQSSCYGARSRAHFQCNLPSYCERIGCVVGRKVATQSWWRLRRQTKMRQTEAKVKKKYTLTKNSIANKLFFY